MTHSVSRHLRIEVDLYDQAVRSFIGGYDEMLDRAAAAVGEARGYDRVIDLGAGTGALSERVLTTIPDSRVELWDVDPAMMAKAAERLARFGDRAIFVQRSFFDPLPPANAVMASLALHHVRELDQKRQLYRAIAAALRPGGVFVNADITIPVEPGSRDRVYRKWADHLVESGIEEPQAWKHFEDWAGEDRYFSLEEELDGMIGAGLEAACYWQREPSTVTIGKST
jgi:tRNA (cmo5U34)-methyltransferase